MIISLINILNKRGLTNEPCGAPVLIDSIEELTSSICTHCLRLDKMLVYVIECPDLKCRMLWTNPHKSL